jgi:glycosyltransferase involved in cell wall biosynthesis
MRALRILLISSALPRDTTAGEVILYRHFSQVPGLHLAIATDDLDSLLAETLLEIKANHILNRLTRTRFYQWTHTLCQCVHPFFNYTSLRNYIKSQQLDLIVTVSEGIHWIAAQKMSQEFGIPLVTIFHDWWPDLAAIHPWAKKTLEHRLKQLYQQSALVFCVSEGMRELLGNHPNAQILYPIPDRFTISQKTPDSLNRNKFKLVYAGSLSSIYAPMLQSLCMSLQEVQGLQFKLFGRTSYCPDAFLQTLNEQNVYGGFIPRDLLRQELLGANALLVTLPFDQENSRFTKTSFPSKLVEYCQYGKPIVIWGPDSCSAVRWGRKYQSALVVTSPLVEDLVKAIKELATQPEEQTRLADRALKIAQGMFNPEEIQRQFIDSLYRVASAKNPG